jgi:hypothetical protein
MNLFPNKELSETEMTIVHTALTEHAVQKYLNYLANDIGRDIVLGQRSKGQSAEEYLCAEAELKGQLSTLDTLLSMVRPETAAPSK